MVAAAESLGAGPCLPTGSPDLSRDQVPLEGPGAAFASREPRGPGPGPWPPTGSLDMARDQVPVPN